MGSLENMSMNSSSESDPQRRPKVQLAASCGIREAAALKQELLPLLAVPEAVTIDVAAVQRIDTSALQLLFAFARDRAERGYPLEWSGLNAVFSDALNTLGLQLGAAAPGATASSV